MTSALQDTAGYKLFAALYKKKRAKDGRRELKKEEIEDKASSHWKSISSDQRKRYNEEAIKRMKKATRRRKLTVPPAKQRYSVSGRSRARSVTPETRSRSRSPVRSRKYRDYSSSSSSGSTSDSSARTGYLGRSDSDDYSDSSYTDTASTYADGGEDEYTDATSCSSIVSSYDDLTEAKEVNQQPKPTTSRKPKPTSSKKPKPTTSKKPKKNVPRKINTKPRAVAAKQKAITKLKAQPRRRYSKRSQKKTGALTDTAMKKANIAAAVEICKKARVQRKPLTSRRRRKPRASKRAIKLKKTPASLSVNVNNQDNLSKDDVKRKPTPPLQSPSDIKLKLVTTDSNGKNDVPNSTVGTVPAS